MKSKIVQCITIYNKIMPKLSKVQIYEKLQELFEGDDTESIIQILCNYYDANELNELIDYIKTEKGYE